MNIATEHPKATASAYVCGGSAIQLDNAEIAQERAPVIEPTITPVAVPTPGTTLLIMALTPAPAPVIIPVVKLLDSCKNLGKINN